MIFEVTPDEIAALDDRDLRSLLGRLAEQEAIKNGYSSVGVTYGGHQNASDGGIDVRGEISGVQPSSYVPRAQTGFQVKAEDLPRAAIIKEMRPNGVLRHSIKELADNNGAYIIVSSKGSVSDTALERRRNAMREAVGDLSSANQLFTEFYDRQRVATWVNQVPGLVPWVKERVGTPLSGWQPFGDWSASPSDVNEEYLNDDHLRLKCADLGDSGSLNIEQGINRLRQILAEPRGAVRLVGLSGVGKTKLAQAIFDERIGQNAINPNFAIYTDLADEPGPVPAELLVRLQNLGQRCVLIVDNCGIELHRKLVVRLQKSDAQISLITIEYDIADETPENTDVFKLEPASDEIIEKIIENRYPNLSNPEIGTITEFSEGNFRIALALAETAKQGQSLANLNDNELFKRLFRQRNEHDPALFKAAMVCSLVYSFDFETLEGEEAELPVLAALAEQSVSEFHAHVSELTRRQLIQQRSKWRALLPHAMAHRLAKQALQDLPASMVADALASKSTPERLLKSFSRRVGCLHDSVEAQQMVHNWIGPDGWLSDVGNLNDLGRTLFDNVAPVNPEATLQCLERAAAEDDSFFVNGEQRDHSLIRLLRSLAYEADFFKRATALIAGFSRDGKESNNMGDAINVFSSLFSLYLSGTMAPPSVRAQTISELAETGNERDGKLALAALEAMLETDHFTSSFGFDFGTRKRDYGYRPTQPEDFREWFEAAINACAKLEKLAHLRDEVRDIVGHKFASLVCRTGMTDELVALAEEFHSDDGWPTGWVAARGALRKLKGTKRSNERAKVQKLVDRLAPQTLEARISSYILPKGSSPLDVVELDFDDDEKYRKAEKLANEIAADIGKELAADLTILSQHLPKLATGESYRLVPTFKAIGENVENIAEAWTVIRDASAATIGQVSYNFAGIYLGAVAKRDRDAAEQILDDALLDEELHPLLVNMQNNAGIDKAGFARLLAAADLPTVPIATFNHLSHRIDWIDYDPEDFGKLVEKIAARENGEIVAFEIMQGLIFNRHHDEQPLADAEKEIGKKLLTNARFTRDTNVKGHRYKNIAQACLLEGEDEAIALQICERLAQGINDYKIYAHDFVGFVGVMAEKFPRQVLDGLIGQAGDNGEISELFDTRRMAKLNPASKMDDDVIFDWIDEAPETRSIAIAHVMPIWERVDNQNENPNLLEEYVGPVRWADTAMELLSKAPEKSAVLKIMVDRFRPNGWSGSLAAIMESRLPLFEALHDHADREIAEIAKVETVEYQRAIDAQKEWEAKHDRARDERFEW